MNKARLVSQAIQRTRRICEGLYGSDFKPEYQLPRTGEEVIRLLKEILKSLKANPRPTSMDIESMYCKEFGKKPLEPFHPEFKVWCLGISTDDYKAICIPFDPDPYLMQKFGLCSIETHPEILLLVNEIMQLNCVTHSTIDAFGLAMYGLRFADLDDSILVAYAIEGVEGELGVADLAKLHTEEGGYKTKDFTVPLLMVDLEWDKLAYYCCHDSDIERRLFFILQEEAKEENVWNGYVNVIKISNMVGIEMTLNGCAMNFLKLFELIQALEEEKAPLLKQFYELDEVNRCFDFIVEGRQTEKREPWRKKYESIQTLADVRVSKTWCVEVLLYDVMKFACPDKTEKGARSTNEETLEKIVKKHGKQPVLELILKIKQIDKELATYLTPYVTPKGIDLDDPIEKQMAEFMSGAVERFPYIKVDGMIHSLFNMHKVRSGRASSEGPNFQNVKNDIDIKSIFVGRLWEN